MEEHLHRFDCYAQRIKKICLKASICSTISNDISSFITLYRQFSAFPILQTLDLSFDEPLTQGVSSLFPLASDTLSTVSIEDVSSSTHFFASSLLQTHSITSQRLVDLNLKGDLTKSTVDLLPGFKKVQRLHIWARREDTDLIKKLILHMPTFEGLNMLEIAVFSWMKKSSKIAIKLAALRELEIFGPLAFFDYFFNSVIAARLTVLHLSISECDAATEIRGSFEWIDKLAAVVPCIERVSANRDDSWCRQKLPSTFFSGVLACKHLRQITAGLVLEGEHLISLVLAGGQWPLMEEIDLQGDLGQLGMLPCLLSQIDLFAAAFPNLKKLSMSVSFRMDSAEFERMRSRIPQKHSCHKLEILHLYSIMDEHGQVDEIYNQRCSEEFGPLTYTINNIMVASQFIDHIFPHLHDFDIEDIFYVDEGWYTALNVGIKSLIRGRINGARDYNCE